MFSHAMMTLNCHYRQKTQKVPEIPESPEYPEYLEYPESLEYPEPSEPPEIPSLPIELSKTVACVPMRNSTGRIRYSGANRYHVHSIL